MWRQIWKLKIPLKVKHFIWHACNNVMPTKLNMCNQLVVDNPNFPFYVSDWESVTHILWECPFARNVWTLVSGPIKKNPLRMNTFSSLQGKC